jgi:exodeoxyribonuclease V alpha subunit
MLTDLSGQIERITYTNEENGFTIAKVKIGGRQDLITVVGNLMAPSPGEILEMRGEWTTHPKFGKQFKVVHFKTKVPVTVLGIKKYLGSGLIRGLGPVMAGRIVDMFGKKTLDIIEDNIERLADVEGIGAKRIAMIASAWEDQKEIRDVMLFLQSHGVGPGFATKIFKAYGNRAIALVKNNPYRLATEIFGIGFLSADRIAQNLGFAKDDQLRIEAGILFVLHQLADDGHVYFPYEPLIDRCREILEVARESVVKALGSLTIDQKVIIEDVNATIEAYQENNKAVFLTRYHLCETGIAKRLKRISQTPKSIRTIDADKAVQWVQQQLSITLADKQLKAIQCAFDNKLLVITGGPGTGKTTIINAIIKILSKINARIMLAAPTGRAAKRMSEASGYKNHLNVMC